MVFATYYRYLRSFGPYDVFGGRSKPHAFIIKI